MREDGRKSVFDEFAGIILAHHEDMIEDSEEDQKLLHRLISGNVVLGDGD